jgi:type II secretory pathway predicted ATPase ExeA
MLELSARSASPSLFDFDEGNLGLVLIGMPGLDKRLARYAQFYSRIGFVHEFRPLSSGEVRQLLAQGWKPAGVTFPAISTFVVRLLK